MAARKRVILDTNLWSRIGKEGTATRFVSALRDRQGLLGTGLTSRR